MTDTILIEAQTEPDVYFKCIKEDIDLVSWILTNYIRYCIQLEKKKI